MYINPVAKVTFDKGESSIEYLVPKKNTENLLFECEGDLDKLKEVQRGIEEEPYKYSFRDQPVYTEEQLLKNADYFMDKLNNFKESGVF